MILMYYTYVLEERKDVLVHQIWVMSYDGL